MAKVSCASLPHETHPCNLRSRMGSEEVRFHVPQIFTAVRVMSQLSEISLTSRGTNQFTVFQITWHWRQLIDWLCYTTIYLFATLNWFSQATNRLYEQFNTQSVTFFEGKKYVYLFKNMLNLRCKFIQCAKMAELNHICSQLTWQCWSLCLTFSKYLKFLQLW